jgi:MFS family permease
MTQETVSVPIEALKAETTPKSHGQKRTIASLSTAFLVDSAEEQALPLLWPYMYTSLGATIGQLGFVLGASKFIATLMFPAWGYAADRFSRKTLLVGFTGIWGLWTLSISFAGSFPQLLVLRVLSGLGLGVFAPAAFSLISDLFDNESRGRATGIMRSIGLLGILLAVMLLPTLAERQPEGWRIGFALLGLASFITGLLMLGIQEPARGASEPELRGVITREAAGRYAVKLADMITLLRIKSWRYLLLNELLIKVSIAVFTGWNFTFLTGLELERPAFFGTVLIVFVGMASGNIIFGWLGDRLERSFPGRGRITMVPIGLFIAVPGVVGYLTSSGDNAVRLAAFGFLAASSYTAAGEGTLWPVAQAILPPELRGSNRAIINMVAGAASALMLALSGGIVDRLGVSTALLWFTPLPVFLSIFAWLPILRTYAHDRASLHQLLSQRRTELLERQ